MDGQPQAGEESAIHQRTAALRRGCRTSPRPRPFVVEFSNGVADVRASLTLIRRTAESLVVTSASSLGISPTPSTYATASGGSDRGVSGALQTWAGAVDLFPVPWKARNSTSPSIPGGQTDASACELGPVGCSCGSCASGRPSRVRRSRRSSPTSRSPKKESRSARSPRRLRYARPERSLTSRSAAEGPSAAATSSTTGSPSSRPSPARIAAVPSRSCSIRSSRRPRRRDARKPVPSSSSAERGRTRSYVARGTFASSRPGTASPRRSREHSISAEEDGPAGTPQLR